MILANLKQLIRWEILCLKIVDTYKNRIKEIVIKNSVYNNYFNSLIKAKKLEIKNILVNEKNNDLVIYFTRYVHSKLTKVCVNMN